MKKKYKQYLYVGEIIENRYGVKMEVVSVRDCSQEDWFKCGTISPQDSYARIYTFNRVNKELSETSLIPDMYNNESFISNDNNNELLICQEGYEYWGLKILKISEERLWDM